MLLRDLCGLFFRGLPCLVEELIDVGLQFVEVGLALEEPRLERLRHGSLHVMDDADQQVALAERVLVGSGASDLPRHAGQRGGKVVLLLLRPRQLDPQRALRFRCPERFKDLPPQHMLRNADADPSDSGGLIAVLDIMPQVIPQVE